MWLRRDDRFCQRRKLMAAWTTLCMTPVEASKIIPIGLAAAGNLEPQDDPLCRAADSIGARRQARFLLSGTPVVVKLTSAPSAKNGSIPGWGEQGCEA
jgi:hypothetical protein